MGTTANERRLHKAVVVGAIAVGLAAGSYGIASAASGNSGGGGSPSSGGATTPPSQPAAPPGPGMGGGRPWGGQRSDETLLTGDTAAKVQAAAEAKVPGGTVVRVETDADGHAKYEAHMTKADGTPVTVYVNEQFAVVGVESR
jgi:hypothetical protein